MLRSFSKQRCEAFRKFLKAGVLLLNELGLVTVLIILIRRFPGNTYWGDLTRATSSVEMLARIAFALFFISFVLLLAYEITGKRCGEGA